MIINHNAILSNARPQRSPATLAMGAGFASEHACSHSDAGRAPVAQLDRVPVFGTGGEGSSPSGGTTESCHATGVITFSCVFGRREFSSRTAAYPNEERIRRRCLRATRSSPSGGTRKFWESQTP